MANVMRCCVNGCRNKERGSRFSFFSLPQETERRNLWLRLIDRQELRHVNRVCYRTFRVCSVHFEPPGITEVVLRTLRPFALPTKLITKRSQPCPVKYEEDTGYIDASTQTTDSEGKEWWDVEIKTEPDEPAPKRKRESKPRATKSMPKEEVPEDLEVHTLRSGTRIPMVHAKIVEDTKSVKN